MNGYRYITNRIQNKIILQNEKKNNKNKSVCE